ncbi:uncharacterized protein F4807DRAFT_308067 [Annulohypoxylon truncatum]|uniref:uncharacterized protein n=1 Tax=Annulohypoxylon truncatum TaxID=327061 RepID=UPI002008CD86|nr:uncharacterized protein F4807DRAFT_308067 [Annulohypoxylon truncatum]KAI1212997.1 hypothetical protein F4807DRAFT_308067 [Annulohypoxylon truncatum]
MTRRNRTLVKYIWLSLELDEYDCSKCGGHDLRHISKTDNCVIITAMHDLFLTLSTWGPQGDLKLDISIHSPSDSQHWFKYLTFGPDTLPHSQATLGQRDDPEHAWIAGKPSSAPTDAALRHVFAEVLGEPYNAFYDIEQESKWWQTLPEVPAITSVLLRLQNRRRWRPNTLTQMLSRLPRLEEFHYEPWRAWSTNDQTVTDQGYCSLFDSLAPRKLRRLILFENFDEQYSSCFARCDNMRVPDHLVGQAITKASLELEHLSASFIIDVEHFLCAVKSGWNWPHLTSLTLTSQLLSGQQLPIRINDMLEAAASTALKMPKLKTMEIWNGKVGSAALFRYQLKGNDCAVLTWKATWKFTLQPRLIKAWEAVAQANTNGTYFVVREFLDEKITINSHADAINFLELSEVLRPTSLQQILAAHEMRLEGMPQGLGLARTQPTAIHKKPSFSGRYWSKAVRYYTKIVERYLQIPRSHDEVIHMGPQYMARLREAGYDADLIIADSTPIR